jgi:hypothetical protein
VFVHFILHVHFSRTEAGRNEIWRSDDFGEYRKLADRTGSNLLDSDASQKSWSYRIGLYEGGGVTQDRHLLYGQLRIGDNIADARSQVALPGIPFAAPASEVESPPAPTQPSEERAPEPRWPAPGPLSPMLEPRPHGSDPAPATSCTVPFVRGLRPAAARRRLRGARCGVGRTRYRRAGRSLDGRVVGTVPRRGTRLARGVKVSLVIGRAPKTKSANTDG